MKTDSACKVQRERLPKASVETERGDDGGMQPTCCLPAALPLPLLHPIMNRGPWAMYENTIPWDLLLEQRHVSYKLKAENPGKVRLAVNIRNQTSHG